MNNCIKIKLIQQMRQSHFAIMYRLCFIVFGITAVVAVPKDPQRIVGGELTTINAYPFQAGLLYSQNLASYWQSCAGSILTTTTVLTAAHCVHGDSISRWRIRVGATFANSGGAVHSPHNIIPHPSYVPWMSSDNDVALIKVASPFVYIPNTVAPASIAGTNYHVADDQVVWAVGWGTTSFGGPSSEQLRHVQVWTINQDICRTRYEELRYVVTENMLCSGWLDVGGRDQCQGDSGGPLIHSNVVVGVSSWGHQCALARYPGVNARVSSYSTWIQANA